MKIQIPNWFRRREKQAQFSSFPAIPLQLFPRRRVTGSRWTCKRFISSRWTSGAATCWPDGLWG